MKTDSKRRRKNGILLFKAASLGLSRGCGSLLSLGLRCLLFLSTMGKAVGRGGRGLTFDARGVLYPLLSLSFHTLARLNPT